MKLKGFRLGILHWNDAAAYTSETLKTVTAGLYPSHSIGFIQRQKDGFLVVYGIQDNKPNDFICIPKGCVVGITWLQPKPCTENPKESRQPMGEN